jgi:hypothetical protein
MRATPLAAFAALFLAALCAFAPGAASAQARDNVYAVSGVQVDETAANGPAAQQAGFASAQRIGLQRLVRRLVPASEIAARNIAATDTMDPAALDRLVRSVDVEEERRSSTRYIGRLTVNFDPAGVRSYLQQQNFTVVDTRTAPELVAPQTVSGTPDETAAMWREVWEHGGFGHELVPLTIAPAALQGAPSWSAAAPFAGQAAAASTLYATLRVQGATATAALMEVSAAGNRDRGEVTARLQGSDAVAMRAALASLAEQASLRVQDDWKSRAATTGTQGGHISASAIYTTQAQWERIKQALEGAAQTLISEIRIEAVGREGALVSFSFVGDQAQVVAELNRRGVQLQQSAMGPTLRVAPTR